MNIPAVPKPETLVFTDTIIAQMQDVLKANLSWLDYSFGKAQKLVTKKDRSTKYYPGVHIGYEKYINVFPDDKLGNYSFVILHDPQEIHLSTRTIKKTKVGFSLVFWFNLDKIFEDKKDRNLEAIKYQILQVVTQRMFLSSGRVAINKIYEEANNIYREYTHNEIESQFLMQPYSGLRFEGTLRYDKFCSLVENDSDPTISAESATIGKAVVGKATIE